MSRQEQKKSASILKKPPFFAGLWSGMQIGMRLAFYSKRLNCICWLCLIMSGCLVTDEISFDYVEKNIPPVIYDVQSTDTAIGDIIYFHAFGVESPSTITFEFRVRDENIGQKLKGRRKIFEQTAGEFFPQDETSSFDIGPSYQPIRNSSFDISQESFKSGLCYRIDLAVSSRFRYASDDRQYSLWYWDTPEDDEDIARASWYVVTAEETSCQWVTEYE